MGTLKKSDPIKQQEHKPIIVNYLNVSSKLQKKGVARDILRVICVFSRYCGFGPSRIFCAVDKKSNSVGFYKKNGFTCHNWKAHSDYVMEYAGEYCMVAWSSGGNDSHCAYTLRGFLDYKAEE